MILQLYFKLFIVFSKIGIFNFGGGYAMLSLIYNDVVIKNHWLSNAEFTDIVAISQSTPGPIGINAATYVGYVSAINAGYPEWMASIASVIASLSIIWLPFILMICISHYLMKHKDNPYVKNIFKALRPTIIGLISAAAILLMNKENFGAPSDDFIGFLINVGIFLGAFIASRKYKFNPILIMIISGIIGLFVELF